MEEFRKNVYRTRSIVTIPPVLFSITSIPKDVLGQGFVDIIGGQPGETIGLSFDMDPVGTFNSLNFSAPITVSVLDVAHPNRTGTMILDGSGSGHAPFDYDPAGATRNCLVTVTSRSSALPDGIGDDTNII